MGVDTGVKAKKVPSWSRDGCVYWHEGQKTAFMGFHGSWLSGLSLIVEGGYNKDTSFARS
jgi:hypothetical protein